MVTEGGLVVTRLTCQGTHKGAIAGAAPTGKKVTFTALEMVRIHDGRATEVWHEGNDVAVLMELGGQMPATKRRRCEDESGQPIAKGLAPGDHADFIDTAIRRVACKGRAYYGVLVTAAIAPGQFEGARKGLRDDVVPRVKKALVW